MKKLFVLFIAILISVAGVSAASITVGGTVTESVSVTSTDGTIALTFGVGGVAADGDDEGTLNVISNKKNWTLTFSSASGGDLTNGKTGDELSTIPYKLAVAIDTAKFGSGATFVNALESAVTLPTLALGGKTIVATKNARTNKDGGTLTVTASVAAQTDALLWDSKYVYSDTVTITIAAN